MEIATADQEALFHEHFTPEVLDRAFEEEISLKDIAGMDRIRPARFEAQMGHHIPVVERKCRDGTYRFTPFAEHLKSKGRGKPPRVISVPTVRDRIVLYQLKEILHKVFHESVNRRLPNAYVRALLGRAPELPLETTAVYKADIASFYDSIDHDILLAKMKGRLSCKPVFDLIRKAVKTPTLPRNYSKGAASPSKNLRGVPQGLAISNILADIYLAEFDGFLHTRSKLFFRYVDDIVVMAPNKEMPQIEAEIGQRLGALRLELNDEKTSKLQLSDGFEYLGYRLRGDEATVRASSWERFISLTARMVSKFKHGYARVGERRNQISKETYCKVFLMDLNEKITGAISGNRRYGWVFYYSQITDVALLHKMDSIIGALLERSPLSHGQDKPAVKSLVKSYYAIKYGRYKEYVHNYDLYNTIEKKIEYLVDHELLPRQKTYDPTAVFRLFERIKWQHLADLELDVGLVS